MSGPASPSGTFAAEGSLCCQAQNGRSTGRGCRGQDDIEVADAGGGAHHALEDAQLIVMPGIEGTWKFGDWLDPAAPPDDPAGGATEPALVATAYFANSARLLSRAAAILGRHDDEHRYGQLAREITTAFRQHVLTEDGQCTSHSQTAYAIVLWMDLAHIDRQRAGASKRLVQLVRAAGHRIGTGFVGTPMILQALTNAAAVDDAYELLLQRDCPSWLYAVSMGATTIWERWDSMLPDGTINPGEMTSFNHYALGAVADSLHSTVAGLGRDAPGYRRIRIAPRPRGPLRDAGATHLTPFGLASVDWRIDGEVLTNSPTGTLMPISLTSVDQSGLKMGAAAGRLLLERIRGRSEAHNEVLTRAWSYGAPPARSEAASR